MHIKALKVFCDVVEQRSFSGAAVDNGVSQPAASQMVSHVEEHLGTKLIDRSQRPIVVTEGGEIFYHGCRKIVDEFDRLEAQLHDLASSGRDQVDVASIYSVGLSHLNRCVQQFIADSPSTNVRVQYQHPAQVVDLVERGRVHFGLMSYPTETRQLKATTWRTEEIVAACAPTHPLARRSELCLTEFHRQAFVGYEERLRIWQEIHGAFVAKRVEPNVVMRFDNTETIKRALEIDAGVGLLPAPTLTREVQAKTLVAIPLVRPGLQRPIGILQRRDRELPDAAKRFSEFLLKDSVALEIETAAV